MAEWEPLNNKQQKEIVQGVVTKFLIPHFLKLGMEASGEWRNALHVRVNAIWGREYTEQLVYGRKPGSYAPIEPLKRWAMIKLGLPEKQALGMAFAISKTLKEKGSSYYRQGGTDLLEYLFSDEVLDYVSEKSKFFVEQEVELEINRYVRSVF